MEVFFFQLFVVMTMGVARVLSSQALLVSAIVWTILTLAMVFAAPLILLQLFVVWVSYALFAPKNKLSPQNSLRDIPNQDRSFGIETQENKRVTGQINYRSALGHVVAKNVAKDGIFTKNSSPVEPLFLRPEIADLADNTDLASLSAKLSELRKQLGEPAPTMPDRDKPHSPET